MLKRTACLLTAASLPVTGLALAAPAAAQSRAAPASVDLEKVVQGSTAYTTAISQINTTYAANFQQAQQLQTSAQAQAQPLVQQAQAEQAKPQPNQAALQTLVTQINQIQQQTQAQLQQIGQPIDLAKAYVGSQISDAIQPAVEAVARSRKVGLVVSREAVLFTDPANDLTGDVVAELNRRLPQVSIQPTPQWLQQRGIGAGQPAAASAPAPTPQPQGR